MSGTTYSCRPAKGTDPVTYQLKDGAIRVEVERTGRSTHIPLDQLTRVELIVTGTTGFCTLTARHGKRFSISSVSWAPNGTRIDQASSYVAFVDRLHEELKGHDRITFSGRNPRTLGLALKLGVTSLACFAFFSTSFLPADQDAPSMVLFRMVFLILPVLGMGGLAVSARLLRRTWRLRYRPDLIPAELLPTIDRDVLPTAPTPRLDAESVPDPDPETKEYYATPAGNRGDARFTLTTTGITVEWMESGERFEVQFEEIRSVRLRTGRLSGTCELSDAAGRRILIPSWIREEDGSNHQQPKEYMRFVDDLHHHLADCTHPVRYRGSNRWFAARGLKILTATTLPAVALFVLLVAGLIPHLRYVGWGLLSFLLALIATGGLWVGLPLLVKGRPQRYDPVTVPDHLLPWVEGPPLAASAGLSKAGMVAFPSHSHVQLAPHGGSRFERSRVSMFSGEEEES